MADGRILVIEDEAGIRMPLVDRLRLEGYEADGAAEGLGGENRALGESWNLLIIDVMLPQRDGMTICQNLRAKGLGIPILLLTARNSDLDVVQGLRSGADDYLCKPFSMAVLLARVEALLRRSRRPVVKPDADALVMEPCGFGDFILDPSKAELRKSGVVLGLNAQEYRLLHYLVSHPDCLLNRETILERVWGYDREITTRTVDVHVARLRQHLGESALPRHILTVRGMGYRFHP